MLDDNEELAEDEEEILVYVEFDGSVAGNTFSNKKLHLDMIGLDTQHPIMQVNGKFYEGTYRDAVGTYMFFEKDKNPVVDDLVFDTIPSLKYYDKSRKVLKMERIFVEPKPEMLGDSNDPNCIPNMETIKKAGIPPRYQEAALRSWEEMRNKRMEELNKYLEKQRIREEKRAQGIEPDSDSDDDNPFAMYKPHVEPKRNKGTKDSMHGFSKDQDLMSDQAFTDFEDSVENKKAQEENAQALDIIDPKPSTSKNSQPWNSPPSKSPEFHVASDSDSDALHINLPNVTGKHKATVKVGKRVTTRKYPRVYKNKAKKKGKQIVEVNDNKDLNQMEPDEMEESLVVSDDQLHELITETVIESQPIDEDTIEVSGNSELSLKSLDEVESIEESPSKDDESELAVERRKLEKQKKRDEKMKLLSEKLKKAAEESKIKAQQSSENGR